VAGCCEHEDEPSNSIKCREFPGQLRSQHLSRKDSTQWSQTEEVVVTLNFCLPKKKKSNRKPTITGFWALSSAPNITHFGKDLLHPQVKRQGHKRLDWSSD
jgi:hypothetical protein